ncbi:MAG: cytochrome C [Methylococcaceae bacterium]
MLPISNSWAADGEDLTEFFTPEFVPEMPITPVVTPPVTIFPVTPPVIPTTISVIENAVDLPSIHPAIPLLDENGTHVLDSQKPYSTRTSCGGGAGCHDIDKISHAYHFEMGHDESDDKFGLKRGLAALTSPAYFGGYSCQNGNNPSWLSKKTTVKEADFLDYGAVGLIKNCEECHAGGGFAEKDRAGKRYDKQPENAVSFLDGDYFEWNNKKLEQWNWKKSGVIEPDCLVCHADFSKFKRPVSEWKTQRNSQIIKNGWFRYANSAILAFLNMSPENADAQTLATLETPANTEPVLKWNEAAFNANGDAQIPMLRFPASENCMLCHSISEQRRGFYGFGDVAKVETNVVDVKDDVHKGKSWTEKGTARVIDNCEACHAKNYYKKALDLSADHQFLTGFSDEDVRRDLNNQPKPLSCEHCHGGKTYGSNEKPALPHSGLSTILDAHRELWRNRGDMAGYAENTLNRVVQVHFNAVACQTCHITKLAYQDKPLKPRFRYRPSEDGKSRIMPYNPASRYYWIDSTNQRVLTRAERLEITNGVDSEPKSYQDVKDLKTRFDDLLKAKGFQKPNAQMIWTETNEYLISHNTRPVADTMPCTDCHDRKRNGSINSAVVGILGENNVRVVAELNDKTAYPKLIKEGVVKLAMPYFKLSDDGKIVENIDDVLYETKLNPFTTQLQSNKINAISGEFQVVARDEILKDLDVDVKTILTAQLTRKAFVFKNPMTGDKVKNIWLAANYTNANKNALTNYRFEIIASDWTAFAFTGNKKVGTLPQGDVSSSVFYFGSRCLNPELICSMNNEKLFLKLPYNGYATTPNEVGLFAVNLVSGSIIDPPKTKIPADIIAVESNYVILSLTQLPERAVLVDLKK